jgi:Flp pilus assembly protein TadD
MLLVLVGCSASGVNNVAIEDRSVGGSSGTPSRVVEQSTEVEVMAFDVRPSFKATTNPSAIQNTEASSQEKAQEVATKAQMPAAVALLNTAEYQSNNGRLNAAQASLERALRISPKDPEVYRSLGEVHRRLGEYVQAEQMLLKGIAVAAGQSSKLRALWSALAKVRSESGDALGANKAFQKSQSY